MKSLRNIVLASSLLLTACVPSQEEQAKLRAQQDSAAAVMDTLTFTGDTYDLIVRSFQSGSSEITVDTLRQMRSHSVLQNDGTACLYASHHSILTNDADFGICSSDTRSFSWSVQRHRVYAKNGQPVNTSQTASAVERTD